MKKQFIIKVTYADGTKRNFLLPEGTTQIPDNYFDSRDIISVKIPEGIKDIGSHAFFGCDKLTRVTIPDSVKSIGFFAFAQCRSLTHVTIGKGVKNIDRGAFYDCPSLEAINIPKTCKIGDKAFAYCESLKGVALPTNATCINYQRGTTPKSDSLASKEDNTMKNQFIIKTNIGDIVVSATRGTVRKVAEAMLKNWTSRPVSYKIFPLGNKINKIKEENARTLASLQKGDQVALVPVFYYDNFNNVKINKIVVIAHNVKMEEDFLRRKIYAGDGKFYYSGSHSRRGTCSAHYNQLDVWGNI